MSRSGPTDAKRAAREPSHSGLGSVARCCVQQRSHRRGSRMICRRPGNARPASIV
jgi:hypothetical protein